MTPSAAWVVFALVVAALLAVDLLVVNRRAHVLSLREATTWSAIVVGVALAFGVAVRVMRGGTASLEYYAGYLVELSLSVDNLFVFLLVFQYFSVPAESHAKVLNWGIFGAAIMRGLMVITGAALLARFEWLFVALGALLLYTAVRMFRADAERIEPERNPLVRLARRFLPMSGAYENSQFLVRTHQGWLATPLLLVVLVVEWTDVVFAIDSIPAIFAITRDPFVVYSSNLFAIIGLRAMLFVLADALGRFAYLKPGVAVILTFVGAKMILSPWVHVPVSLSLVIIATVLVAAVVLSVVRLRGRPPLP
jgi:tellurite resistance protein TerC